MTKRSAVRMYIGTRKGGYIAESDGSRRRWKVNGPFQPDREVFHTVPDPRHDGVAYAAVNSGFVGPLMMVTSNHGRNWRELPLPEVPGTPIPLMGAPEKKTAIVNLWHIEPGPESEPDSLFVGIDPAALFRSDDRGRSWAPVSGLNDHETRAQWGPGAGGMCLHTILIDPEDPKRMYVGISAAGTFRSDDGGDHWRPMNHGVRVNFLPDPEPIVGQCVHHVALDPEDSKTLYRQDHNGIFVTHDRMENWKRIGRSLPYDFGFVSGTTAGAPGEAFFLPVHPESRVTSEGGFQVYRWNDHVRSWRPMVKGSGWPGEYGTHREGMTLDHLDPWGIYIGTTTGQVIYSRDEGKNWAELPHQFPAIHSISVASSNSSAR